MKTKVTIQDIADALNLSRNTVSKALNNHPQIPKMTRDKVIKKAIEMKYKHFAHMETSHFTHSIKTGNIALLTRNDINAISFYSMTINGIEERLRAQGCNLILALVTPIDILNKTLPPNINKKNIDGIICIEIFDRVYIETVLDAEIPTVFIDTIPNTTFPGRRYSTILMDNIYSTYSLTKMLIANGHKEIGFIGDIHHCQSFYERWLGYERALRESGITNYADFSITLEDTNPYLSNDWMKNQLKSMKKIPTAFVCANDDIAITAIRNLKDLGFQIPDEIEVTGFDDIPNAEIIDPPLTTVHTFRHELGVRTVEFLFSRIEQPERHNETLYLETKVVKRSSTR
jgi:LacI family transcriptional regulator